MSIRATLKDFIELYRSETCLWRVKSKDYHDRSKRAAAYAKLLEKLKQLEPNSTKEDVVRKINTFRSNVRREKKKCDESKMSGASEVHKPTLWYYNLFDFIGDQETHRSIQSKDGDESESNISENTTDDFTENSTEIEQNSTQKNHVQITTSSNKRKDFKRPASPPTEDQCDLIGRTIAIKLRSLEKRQRLIAEKIINDTLFDAEMGNLNTEAYPSSSSRNMITDQAVFARNSTLVPLTSPNTASRSPSPH